LTVQVHHDRANFVDLDGIEVLFGDKSGYIVRILDNKTIVVKIPRLDPGPVVVTVRDRGSLVGIGGVDIMPPSKKRLYLTYDNGDIALRLQQPYTGHFDKPFPGEPRLSYDVLDDNGNLLYTNALRLPGSRGDEVLGDPSDGGGSHRILRSGRIPFGVKIPYHDGTTIVRFYDVPVGSDLNDPQDRANRTLIDEISITQ
jgi:hypothetical protein